MSQFYLGTFYVFFSMSLSSFVAKLCDSVRCLKAVFSTVLQEQFSEVLDGMFEVLVKPQEHIIDQGDDGDNFYVIEK